MTGAVTVERATFRYPGSGAGIFDLSLEVAPGELVVCIGPSGCGKTTLLKLIAGFLRPERGTVRLAGGDVTNASVRSRELGIVFQAYALFPHMTVSENVAYPLRVRGVDPAERRRRAGEMLELVGLAGLGDRLPAELSGGQQQRVALARALAFKPRALLLDEPLSALDAATRIAMRDEVRRIQRSQSIATLLITHDQDEALSLADRIAILRDGRLVQTAPAHEVYDRPADGFVAGFVGRANLLPGEIAGAGQVNTSLGALATPPHGKRAGERVLVLIRPERVEVAAAAGASNTFAVEVTHDRFYGATRQLDLACRGARIRMETLSRGEVRYVHVPPEAVQFLAPT
jgi:putative spermidine/putrescine transport system ATP-binding protein